MNEGDWPPSPLAIARQTTVSGFALPSPNETFTSPRPADRASSRVMRRPELGPHYRYDRRGRTSAGSPRRPCPVGSYRWLRGGLPGSAVPRFSGRSGRAPLGASQAFTPPRNASLSMAAGWSSAGPRPPRARVLRSARTHLRRPPSIAASPRLRHPRGKAGENQGS